MNHFSLFHFIVFKNMYYLQWTTNGIPFDCADSCCRTLFTNSRRSSGYSGHPISGHFRNENCFTVRFSSFWSMQGNTIAFIYKQTVKSECGNTINFVKDWITINSCIIGLMCCGVTPLSTIWQSYHVGQLIYRCLSWRPYTDTPNTKLSQQHTAFPHNLLAHWWNTDDACHIDFCQI